MKFFLLFVSLSHLATAHAGFFSFLGADRGKDTARKLRGDPVFSAEFDIFCTRRCENPGESCIPNPARYNIQKDVYQCTCSEGHVYTANNDACKFEEQCKSGASPCGKNAECVQNEGGFACVCPTDWSGGAYTECIAPERLQTPAPVAATPAPVPVPSTPAPQASGGGNRTRALMVQQIKKKVDIRTDIPFHLRPDGDLPSDTVYMTGPFEPVEAILAIKLQNDVQVKFFNNSAMTKSVRDISVMLEEEKGIEGVYEAYLSLRPWAFRSDLWRLMILWAYGGIYVDADLLIREPFLYWATLNQEEEIATCVDLKGSVTKIDSTETTAVFFQAMLSAKKGSPLLVKAIDAIVDTIKHRRYGIDGFESADLSITGPIALGYALRGNYHKVRTSCRLKTPLDCDITECAEVRGYVPSTVATPWEGEVARRVLAENDHEIREMLGHNITEQSLYAQFFSSKSVYCDEEGPTCTY